MPETPDETTRLIEQAAGGERQSWGRLLDRHRDRLRRMVALRLDRRLHGRIDPSDVIQEAYLDATHWLDEYARALVRLKDILAARPDGLIDGS